MARFIRRLSALPGEVSSLRRKGIAPISNLEQILVAKVFNFGGICSDLSGLIAALVLFFPTTTQAQLPCAPRNEIVTQLAERFQETPEANGITPQGLLLEVFVSKTRSWTVLLTTPQGLACVAAVGENWEREFRKPDVDFQPLPGVQD
jgi:hypothetical protein